MRVFVLVVAVLSLLGALGCSDTGRRRTGDASTGDGAPPPAADEDGDGISDTDEGRASNRDTDGDGTPDYLDDDSDGDGIFDSIEAGDADTATPPEDADMDGMPNYVDDDSDGNGIPDAVEGIADADGDGREDFRDLDDDEDRVDDVTEIGDPAAPADFDGDGLPDFRQPDSDNDTILDGDERPRTGDAVDTDMDGTPDWQDDDSDGDGWLDSEEAGDMDIRTPPVDTDMDGTPDFRDVDSDADGLSDADERVAGTSPTSSDTDGDGVSDLIEVGAGTDPGDPTDNPRARGDFVFEVPYMEPPMPTSDDLAFSTELRKVDIYIMVDRSGSMTSEITSVRNNIQTVLDNLTCPSAGGSGDPADCIEDLWAGIASIGYAGSPSTAYTHHLDVQPDPSIVGPALATSEPSGCCDETMNLAVWGAATGMASSAAPTAGCTDSALTTAFPAKDCSASPAAMAGLGGTGYPCFRDGALPVIMLATDEPPSVTHNCPTIPETITAMNAISAKMIGILGSGTSSSVRTDLESLASGTGAVDTSGSPLVFPGADSTAAMAIENAVRTLANAVRVDISAVPVDDPSDSVDAVAAFVDHLETLQLGTAECTDMLMEADSDGDGFPDLYQQVLFGTPVCWRIFAKQNDTVMPTTDPQVFTATIQVYGDGVTLLDERDVFFLVPPEIVGPGGPD